MNSFNLSGQFSKSSRRLALVLMIALLVSIGLSVALAPTLIAQAGFTPTPVPPTLTPTPTNTPLATPTSTPVSPGPTAEPPLLPQTGGYSLFPVAILALILLVIVGFGWAGINLRRDNSSQK